MAYKDPSEQQRKQQELNRRAEQLDQQERLGTYGIAEIAGKESQLRQDTVTHQIESAALYKRLKAERIQQDSTNQRNAEHGADKSIRNLAENNRAGGAKDVSEFKGIQVRKETEWLRPISGISPLTVLKARAHTIARTDLGFQHTHVWLEGEWNGIALPNLFLVCTSENPVEHKRLRALTKDSPISVRVLAECAPAHWSPVNAQWAGRSYIRVLGGFSGRVQVGDIVEATVGTASAAQTSGTFQTPEGEWVHMTISHEKGHPAVSGLFGTKNKPGHRFQAQVTGITVSDGRDLRIAWDFAPGASIR
jgi:hypothetical protein